MTSRIQSIDALPEDVQAQESATFSYGTIRQILSSGYYRGPAENGGKGKGMRAQALRSKPGSHRKSILRKAVETDLLKETAHGYATTERGYGIYDRMTICGECGADESPYIAGIRTGRRSGYGAIFTECPSCEDPLASTNVKAYERPDEAIEIAIEVMQSDDVVCYLNGKTLDQAMENLGI